MCVYVYTISVKDKCNTFLEKDGPPFTSIYTILLPVSSLTTIFIVRFASRASV